MSIHDPDHISDEEKIAEHYLMPAKEHMNAGRFREAAILLFEGLNIYPDNPFLLCTLAKAMEKLKFTTVAVDLYKRAHTKARNDPVPLRALGRLAAKSGEHDDALSYMKQSVVLEHDPRVQAVTLAIMANIEVTRHRYEHAIAFLDESLSINEDDIKTLTTMGVCFFETGKLDEAEHYARLAYAKDRSDPYVLSLLSKIMDKKPS